VKEKYEYEFCVKQEQTPGKVRKNKRVGIADTTVAFLSGQLTEKDETVPYANVTITGKENSFQVGHKLTLTDT